MTSARFNRINYLYKRLMSKDLISLADDVDSLLSTEEEKPIKKIKEKEEFVPVEEISKQLGGGEIEKKTPLLPHREKEKILDVTLPKEMETSKFTPGSFIGKICDVCGSFNYPIWKKECSKCKKYYKTLRDLVDFKGLTPENAVKAVAMGIKTPTEDELRGMISSPKGQPYAIQTKSKTFLGEPQLKEIWDSKGVIPLPEAPVDLEQHFMDRKGFRGVPNSLKLQNILDTKLNVQRVGKEVFDPKTKSVMKTKDVYFDQAGLPVPIKPQEKDYFSLIDISRKLHLDPTGIIKTITEHNTNLNPKDPSYIKPAAYIDEQNQAFSWKSLAPLFKERLEQIFEEHKNLFLSKLDKQKEKLEEQIGNIGLSVNMMKHNKERTKEEMSKHPNKEKISTLFKLRQQAKDLTKKLADMAKFTSPEMTAKKESITKELDEVNNIKSTLEKAFGKTLDRHIKQVENANNEIKRMTSRLERLQKAKDKVIAQGKEYLTTLGQTPEEITLSDLDRAQTGQVAQPEGEDYDLEALSKKITTKSSTINKFLKIAIKIPTEEEETEENEPEENEFTKKYFKKHKPISILPGQSRFKGIDPVWSEPTRDEIEKREIRLKTMMKGKLTKEEAEDRLEKMNDPLADEESLTPQQKRERNLKIQKMINSEHPTKEEAEARLELVEHKPVKPIPQFKEPELKETLTFGETPCPHCGKKKMLGERCSNCGFVSKENEKDVIVEKTEFRLIYDKNGNMVPKLDEAGNQMLDARGLPMWRKRIEKQYSLVTVHMDDLGDPLWATARKVSAAASTAELPKIREPNPITTKLEDFRKVYEIKPDEKGEDKKVDTGEKEHKQQCTGCPAPWVKIPAEDFDKYDIVKDAINFITGQELSKNTKAYMFKDVYAPKKEEIKSRVTYSPTILPTS